MLAQITLSAEEQRQLDDLTSLQIDIARELAKIYPTAFDPSDFDITRDWGISPDLIPNFDNSAGLLALDFEDNSNPVLRAAARSIIEDLFE